jgi:hypothetical protein
MVRLCGACALLEVAWMSLLVLAMLNSVRSEVDSKGIMSTLLLTMGFQAALGMTTAVGLATRPWGEARVTGTVGTVPSAFATFMELLVVLVWRRFSCSASRGESAVNAVLAAAGTLVVVLTLDRSSWLGLLIGFLPLECVCRKYALGARRLNSRAAILLGMLACGALVALPLLQSRKANLGAHFEKLANLTEVAVRMVTANPVARIGPGVYGFHIKNHAAGVRTWLCIVHNDLLLILAQRGLLGFLAWLLWLRAGVRQAKLGAQTLPMPLREVPAVQLSALAVLAWESFWNSAQPFSSQALVWLFFGLVSGMNKLQIRAEDPAASAALRELGNALAAAPALGAGA